MKHQTNRQLLKAVRNRRGDQFSVYRIKKQRDLTGETWIEGKDRFGDWVKIEPLINQ
jgi:hypothetical protein